MNDKHSVVVGALRKAIDSRTGKQVWLAMGCVQGNPYRGVIIQRPIAEGGRTALRQLMWVLEELNGMTYEVDLEFRRKV